MPLQVYLDFDGRAEEAIEFYKSAIKATNVFILRNADAPEKMECPDGTMPPADKIMHCHFSVENTEIMGSDGYCKGNPKFEGITLSLSYDSESEVDETFARLSEGGEVIMPPTPTFFSKKFGMVKDKIGVTWMVLVSTTQTPQS